MSPLNFKFIGLKKLQAKLGRSRQRWGSQRLKLMRRMLQQLDIAAQKRLSGSPLARRTGNLARLGQEISAGGEEGRIGPQVPYGAIHEFGGIIKPVKGKFLAIPLDAAKTAAGVARGGPKDFDDTFVVTSKLGNLLIAQSDGGGDITPLFALKEQVEIPARPYLGPALEEKRTKLAEMAGSAMKSAVVGGVE